MANSYEFGDLTDLGKSYFTLEHLDRQMRAAGDPRGIDPHAPICSVLADVADGTGLVPVVTLMPYDDAMRLFDEGHADGDEEPRDDSREDAEEHRDDR